MSNNIVPPGTYCVFCGISTATRRGGRRPRPQLRSYELSESYMAKNPQVEAYAHHIISGRPIEPSSDRICRPCFQRATRFYAREQNRMATMADVVDNVFQPSSDKSSDESVGDPLRGDSEVVPQDEEDPQDELDLMQVPDEARTESPAENLNDDLEEITQPHSQDTAYLRSMQVPVPGFSRVSSNATYCTIEGCNVKENLNRLKTSIRAYILRKDSIYIPPEARVCSEHLHSVIIWQDFADYTRPRYEIFNPLHISNMMKLLKNT